MRNAQRRAKCVFRKFHPVVGSGLHQTAPQLAVRSQRAFRMFQVALQDHGRAIVEWMRQRRFTVDPFQSVIRQRQRGKKWRTRRERIHC